VLFRAAGWLRAELRDVTPSGRVVTTQSHKWIKDS
jgi:hypothetical protein